MKVMEDDVPPGVKPIGTIVKFRPTSMLLMFDKKSAFLHDGGLGPEYEGRCWHVATASILEILGGKDDKVMARGKAEVKL